MMEKNSKNWQFQKVVLIYHIQKLTELRDVQLHKNEWQADLSAQCPVASGQWK